MKRRVALKILRHIENRVRIKRSKRTGKVRLLKKKHFFWKKDTLNKAWSIGYRYVISDDRFSFVPCEDVLDMRMNVLGLALFGDGNSESSFGEGIMKGLMPNDKLIELREQFWDKQ